MEKHSNSRTSAMINRYSDQELISIVTFKLDHFVNVQKLVVDLIDTRAELKKHRKAIKSIAPWLSASLSDDSCKEYHDACDRIFELDNNVTNKNT